eukprot:16452375-Heterocapsa_arctica.AAC.1
MGARLLVDDNDLTSHRVVVTRIRFLMSQWTGSKSTESDGRPSTPPAKLPMAKASSTSKKTSLLLASTNQSFKSRCSDESNDPGPEYRAPGTLMRATPQMCPAAA